MSDLKEKKFGYIVNNQPCPGHFHPPYPPMPPPVPGVTMKDLIQYVNSYIDVRAKQIYEKIKEHQGGIDKQEIIDAVIAQFRNEIGNEVQRYIENHVNFEQLIREQIQDMDFLTPSSSEFTQLKSSIGNLNGQVSGLSAQVQEFGQSLASLNTQVGSLSNSVASLGSTVNGLTTTMAGISSSVNDLTAIVNTLSSDVADLKSQMQNVVTASTLNQKLGSYATNNRVDGIDAAVSGLSNTVATLSNQVSDILGDWASVKERTGQIPGILSDIASLKASASTFASKAYVDASISALSASLSSYATQEYVASEIAKINTNNDWDDRDL